MAYLKRLAKQRTRRRYRVRNNVRRSANGKPRLSVHRSGKHIYAQVIDDVKGETIVSASTLDGGDYGSGKYATGNKDAAAKVGAAIAEKALEKGVKEVIFDRGPYKYHGRVQALADAAREKGLQF